MHPNVSVAVESMGVAQWPLYQSLAVQLAGVTNQDGDFSQGDIRFCKRVLVKLATCLAVLDLGHEIFWLDADVVVLKDPLPYLKGSTADFNVRTPP